MPYVSVHCPKCGQDNEIAQGSSTFFCSQCGEVSAVEYEYVYEPPKDARPAPVATSEEDVARRLKRAFLFLEDGEWDRAWLYAESALDYDPENATAYLAELLVVLQLRSPEELGSCKADLSRQRLFNRALKFADGDLRQQLDAYAARSAEEAQAARLDAARTAEQMAKATEERRAMQEADYQHAVKIMDRIKYGCPLGSDNGGTLWDAIQLFESLGLYKDAPELCAECRSLREDALHG